MSRHCLVDMKLIITTLLGNCWRNLPLEEKKIWEQKAKHEKAAHKIQYPHYRFRPVHNKNKKKDAEAAKNASKANSAADKSKHQPSFEEEIRCEEVTQLLLEGKKGEELAQALRDLEKRRDYDLYRRSETPSTAASMGFATAMSAPQPSYPANIFANQNTPLYLHRRSSSVPLPATSYDWMNTSDMFMGAPPSFGFGADDQQSQPAGGIALPSVQGFLAPPPPSGGLGAHHIPADARPSFSGLSKQQRVMYGHRRTSSAGAAFGGIQRGFSIFAGAFGGSELDGSFNWAVPANPNELVLQRDDTALPEADLSLFDPQFLNSSTLAAPQTSVAPHTTTSPQATIPEEVDPIQQQPASYAASNASTTPNGAFTVTELYNGLPPQQELGPLDTTGLGLNPQMMVSPTDSTTSHPSASAGFWNAAPATGHMQQQQPIAPTQVDAMASGGHAQYEQMYMGEQGGYSMMGNGYEAGYDMESYVNVGGFNQQGYVEC